jgi:hypothetical protein
MRFRTSPSIELKRLGELPAEERAPFVELEKDPEFYGILFARPPLSMTVKAVPRAIAEILQSLRTPMEHDGDLTDLVLDGIVEIESEDGFVSGADAPFDWADPQSDPLSRAALLYAQDLETRDVAALSSALYHFHRIPRTPFWTSRFADRETILHYLGADSGALRTLLEREWIASDPKPSWIYWRSRSRSAQAASDITYKLYISPRPERIRDVFASAVRVLAAFPGTPFKIGNGAGMLRPDKFVAYFPTREVLDEAAAALQQELGGCEPHGVPFTAAIDDAGLLSWGMDPPQSDRVLQWMEAESWRYWVVHRLAAAISIAKGARTARAIEPWRFACERARRHGIDVATWTPSASLWSVA